MTASISSESEETLWRMLMAPYRRALSLASRDFADQLLASDPARSERLLPAYALFGELLNVERGREGVLHAVDGVAELIEVVCEVGEIDPFTSGEWVAAVGEFREDLRRHPAAAAFEKAPQKEVNICLYFLSRTRKQLLEAPDGADRWRKLCVAAYRATRLAVNNTRGGVASMAWGRAKRSARAIQIVALYLSPKEWRNEAHQQTVHKSAIADAIERSLSEEPYKRPTANSYRRYASALLNGQLYKWKGTRRSGGGGVREPDDEPDVPITPPDDDIEYQWEVQNQLEKDEGAAPGETELPPDTPIKSATPPGSADSSYALQPVGVTPVWARGHLTPEVLGTLLSWLATGDHSHPSRRRAVLAFVRLLIMFGCRADVLMNAKREVRSSLRQKWAALTTITYHRGTLHISPRRTEGKAAFALPQTGKVAELYLPASHSFELRLSAYAREHLDTAQTASGVPTDVPNELDKLFIHHGGEVGHTIWMSLTIKVVNEVLGEFAKLIGEPVDAARIGRSAAVLLRDVGGLNELIAAYIQGEVPRHLASQSHYTNLAVTDIGDAHELACREVFACLRERSARMITRYELPPLADEPFDLAPVAAETTEVSTPAELDRSRVEEVPRLGSPFVPKLDLLRKYFTALRESIDADDWRVGFNRLTAYTTLTLMCLTGLRSLELKWLSAARLCLNDDGMSGTLAVKAKYNQSFREWRALDLPMFVARQLVMYCDYRERAVRRLIYEHGRTPAEIAAKMNDAVLFFVRPGFLPRPVTTAALSEQIREAPGADRIELEVKDFERRMTCPRHLFRSTAMKLRRHATIIDAIMGHSTRGRDPLGLFSLYDWTSQRTEAELIAAYLVEELRLTCVRPLRW